MTDVRTNMAAITVPQLEQSVTKIACLQGGRTLVTCANPWELSSFSSKPYNIATHLHARVAAHHPIPFGHAGCKHGTQPTHDAIPTTQCENEEILGSATLL